MFLLTNDDIFKYISNMGNNLTSYSIATSEENSHKYSHIYFLTPHFTFIKRDRIDDNELLNTNENSVDPFDYHVSNCGKDSFRNCEVIKFIQIMILTVNIY